MSNWFQTPSYFFSVLCLGFIAWCFSFSSDTKPVVIPQESNFSSLADSVDESLYTYNDSSNPFDISDDELLAQIEIPENKWDEKADIPFRSSPAELEDYVRTVDLSYGDTPANPDYVQISASEPAIETEDPKTCKPNRLVFNQSFKTNKALAELIKPRDHESEVLPKKCITHVMNKFSVGPANYARCTSSKGQPARGGAKPCITEEYVNLTYNSFLDVTQCLNLNPLDILPKLSNESGMLINTLGVGFDAGVGQLTGPAIEETNKYYDKYLAEIEKAASTKPSCARLIKNKALLGKVPPTLNSRCGLISPPENPLRNILYMAIFNRRNMDVLSGFQYIAGVDYILRDGRQTPATYSSNDELGGRFEEVKIQEKLARLGLKDINLNQLVEMVAFAGYNTGAGTAFNIFVEYIEKRLAARRPLTTQDFDFHNPKMAKDIDGKEKPVTEIARLFASSPIIKTKDPSAATKLQRVKILPEKIRTAHMLTFPEFMIYNQNNYDKSRLRPDIARKIQDARKSGRGAELKGLMAQYSNYQTIGAPGYLSFLAAKDKAIRQTFQDSSANPDYCSNKNFLKIK